MSSGYNKIISKKQAEEIVDYENANNDRGQWPVWAVKAEGWLDCYSQMSPLVAALEKARTFIIAETDGYDSALLSEIEKVLGSHRRLMGEGNEGNEIK